ncbi:MAG: ATP synthase F1 subunit delta [Deltaproteobacteria bacterium]|nr:ATP synthase F1 subunit delta [Deltaproteobacteria bacterium]
MIEGKLSRRYARAFFYLAAESGHEEEIGQEIERFIKVYGAGHLEKVLNNPAFGLEARKRVTVNLAEELQLSSLSVRFLSLLLDRDRLGHVHSIAFHYRRFQDEALGRVKASVTGAKPLDGASLERLITALERISGKKVVLEERTDPELLGGLVLHMEGKVYDGSLRTQLENLKKQIEEGY